MKRLILVLIPMILLSQYAFAQSMPGQRFTSLFLNLVIVPVIYDVFDGLQGKLGKRL